MRHLIAKIKRNLSHQLVYRMRPYPFYPFLYRSTMHGFVPVKDSAAGEPNFMTAIPHAGAGIGHQMANWIAGYWFAGQFGCRYAHAPFADDRWEELLGFGRGEVSIAEARAQGYRTVRLPLFDEGKASEFARIGRIIASYRGKRILFLLERDQFHRAQYGTMAELAAKFNASPPKQSARLIYDATALNIAVHIRRGDVSLATAETSSNIMMRWQEIDYFERVLDAVLNDVNDRDRARIHVFSQGTEDDFTSFSKYSNLRLCLDMEAQATFLHLAAADVLIGSKSGFSYCPALLSHGVRILPTPFWHDYPDHPLWISTNSRGDFDESKLKAALALGARE